MAKLAVCPDCRAEISMKAIACPKCGRPSQPAKKKHGILKLGLVLFLLFVIVSALNRGPNGRPAPVENPAPTPPAVVADAGPKVASTPKQLQVGDRAVIAAEDQGGAWVGDADNYDFMVSAHGAGKLDQLIELTKTGKVAHFSQGTRVIVTGTGVFSTKVKATSGLHEGFEGWTASELDHAASPAPATTFTNDLPPHKFSQSLRPGFNYDQIRSMLPKGVRTEAEIRGVAVALGNEAGTNKAVVSFYDDEAAVTNWDGRGGSMDATSPHYLCFATVIGDESGQPRFTEKFGVDLGDNNGGQKLAALFDRLADPEKFANAAAEKIKQQKAEKDETRAASLLRVGQNLEKIQKEAGALKAYQDIVRDYPGTPSADAASKRIEAMQAKP